MKKLFTFVGIKATIYGTILSILKLVEIMEWPGIAFWLIFAIPAGLTTYVAYRQIHHRR